MITVTGYRDSYHFLVLIGKIALGRRKKESREERDRFTRREFSFYSFFRSFTLPEDVKPGCIEARHENGLLKIVLHAGGEVKQTTARLIAVP